MIGYGILVGAAILTAVIAIERTRRVHKRLERLREAYWDLRYEFGQLQARLNRLEAERAERPAPAPAAAATNFVPLSSLKR
jgi:hypothetical protein